MGEPYTGPERRKRPRGGQPRAGKPAIRRFWIRMTDDEYMALMSAAALNLVCPTEFAREAINEAAEDCGEQPIFRHPKAS